MKVPLLQENQLVGVKPKAAFFVAVLAISFVSWQTTLLYGFTWRMPRSAWAVVDSYGLSSIFFEATLALTASLLAGRILSLAVYFSLSSLAYIFRVIARRAKNRPIFRRLCGSVAQIA